ncbi:DUF6065 family protein [Sneathiella chinensis]|uniref:DUF4123 domain-containing protein n=1 Tax=Sneathiella chinensis TaxID=349750 RepID=A0ABQ5U870_9PROT|nr:DUF6065 family protein [Sneathiella chinensis]GLQ07390.1 hypothetical protein GCM10007924_26110 [Sneathiella chinensis]
MHQDSPRLPDTRPQETIVKFFRLIPHCPLPQRADRAAGGLLPTRAFRYCEPMTTASAFGWYAFAPLDFSVVWDGVDILWTWPDADSWYPLDAVQFPDFRKTFDASCPEALRGYAPPFLSAPPEPGLLKIWTGLIARTAPDWRLLVRAPANLPRSLNFEHFEGIIETDRWFGPLFTNLRLTKTDIPIRFRTDMPLVQLQPLHRSVLDDKMLNSFEIGESLDDLDASDWQAYHDTLVAPGGPQDRERGLYARTSRQNAKKGSPSGTEEPRR